jgi:hypothetical protein
MSSGDDRDDSVDTYQSCWVEKVDGIPVLSIWIM